MPARIGVSLSQSPPRDARFARPTLYVHQTYLNALAARGALPVPLAFVRDELIDAQLDGLDGVMITGGVDLHPAMYGETTPHPTCTITAERDAHEAAVMRRAVERGIPVLGVCRGMQLMAALFGGRLYQDRTQRCGTNQHTRREIVPRYHAVRVAPDSRLQNLVGDGRIHVNSSHHQFVRDVPAGFRVNAVCEEDEVIEGLEATGDGFVVGVQWHPERMTGEKDPDGAMDRLWRGFIAVCEGRR